MTLSISRSLVTLGQIVFVVVLVVSATACSRAHVLVLDQNNDPIEGVNIHTNIQPGNAYFFRSKTTIKYTNKKGRATFPVGSWFRFTRVEKEGYQFREMEQLQRKYGNDILGTYAKRFTRKRPLILRGWKRGEVPDLTYISGRVFFPDTVEHCTVQIMSPTEGGETAEPIYFRIKLESDYAQAKDELRTPTRNFVTKGWHGSFAVSRASVIDTDGLFMNRAPEQGYSEGVVWGPFLYAKQERGIDNESRQLFIKSDHGEYYGGAVLLLEPDRGTKASMSDVEDHRVYFQAWFNFSGSTDIMRDEWRTVWSNNHDFFYNNYYCREAPEGTTTMFPDGQQGGI